MTVQTLTPALEKVAKKELNEDPRRTAADIDAIKEWMKMQPHLHSCKPNDQWILTFLRGCKFSLERTKEKLDMFYTLRAIVPEFYSERDPMNPKLQEILKDGIILPLKQCASEDSPRVLILRVGSLNPAKYHITDIVKVSLMITDILMLEDNHCSVSGEVIVIDLEGAGMNLFAQWTPALAKKTVMLSEKALPVRQKSQHILNTPTGFEAAFKILKLFLGEKMKKRIKVHNQNYKEMFKSIPRKILPQEYQGEAEPLQELIDYWKSKVESYRDWFIEQEKEKSDESKRDGQPKSSSDFFGVEGSFRKLELD